MVEIANSLLKYFAPKQTRSFLDFAEQEIVMPDGIRKGLKYTSKFMPWDVEFFKVLDGDHFNRFWSLGSVQSGKTFRVSVIPTLYHLFEIEEDVILGAPDERMANAFYDSKIKPIIKLSKYAKFLPKEGKGSRGGSVQSLIFRNGARLRFMGAGGGDAQRSGHTARVVIISEVDKMDKSTAASKETDPISQMESRSDSYGDNARLYGECTISTSLGRVNMEAIIWGSNSRCKFKCPYCKEHVFFEREYFTGWQGHDNEMDARKGARYVCPSCSAPWIEADRQKALRSPIMFHEKAEETRTFGFSWNAMSSGLMSMELIAQKEYVADRADTPDARKKINQFCWALAYDENTTEDSGITKDLIINKITKHIRGQAPDNTEKITVGIDLGKYYCWWSVWAWSGLAVGHCIDYGAIDVQQGRNRSDLAILDALSNFRDEYLIHGWKHKDGIKKLDLVLVDSGYEADVSYEFTKNSGNQYLPLKGFGTGRNEKTWRVPKSSPTRTLGHEWAVSKLENGINLVELHADFWKAETQNGFSAPSGHAGSLSLFEDEKRNHMRFARQITNEVKKSEFIPGKGIREYWEVISRDNHSLDTSAYARAAADIVGLSVIPKEEEAPRPAQRPQFKKGNSIRSRY